MKPATEIRGGMVIRLSDELFRVVEAEYHVGGGKMTGAVHAWLRNLGTSHLTERRFRPDERLEDVSVDRRSMEFIYDDADSCTFMDPETFEQVSLPKETLGPFLPYLQPNEHLQVEFVEEVPLDVIYPPTVTVRVDIAPEPLHGQHDNVLKTVVLENGLEVLAPQFIREGDSVRIDVESGKYVERVTQAS